MIEIKDRIFRDDISHFEHEELKHLTFFYARADSKEIFKNSRYISDLDAELVATRWYNFSLSMPDILLNCARNISIPEQKISFIKIALEELGEDECRLAHSKLFLEASSSIGLKPRVCSNIEIDDLVMVSLERYDHYLLGLGFGLEIIANSNIDCLIHRLSRCRNSYKVLESTSFFRIHFKNEDQHIKSSFNNFIRYCSEDQHKENFLLGFDRAINFWKKFWSSNEL